MMLIDESTFVPIPDIKELFKKLRERGTLPPRDAKYENIFYRTIHPHVNVEMWLALIYSNHAILLKTNPEWVLNYMNLSSTAMNELSNIEMQRQCEMFYVYSILERLSAGVFDLRDVVPPGIFDGIVSKYKLKSQIFSAKPKRKYTKRSHRVGAHHVVEVEVEEDEDPITMHDIEKMKRDLKPKYGEIATRARTQDLDAIRDLLIRCKSVISISKTLKYKSPDVVYSVMEENLFAQPGSFRREMDSHVGTVKRAMRAGRSWEYYIRTFAICERELYKRLMERDPAFVDEYGIIPSRESLIGELQDHKVKISKVAEVFGVNQEDVRGWMRKYGLFESGTAPRETPEQRAERERKKHKFLTEEHVELIGEVKKQSLRDYSEKDKHWI